MNSLKMSNLERRAVISLSSIMALRMIGLFMVVPLFALYAHQLAYATPTLIGLAIGIYGLSQAIFQLPFGALSDRFGRKPIILIGLLLFATGSLLCAFAHSMIILIIGRTLQGAGAVGSTILAMLADLTREEQRTKSMAVVGITIGFSFLIAMILGPILAKWMSINKLFFVAFFMSFIAIALLYCVTPTPLKIRFHADMEPELKSLRRLLFEPNLAKLNIGIFILHAIFTASFVVIPIELVNVGLSAAHQWILYLPTLFLAFTLSAISMSVAERKKKIKFYFLSSIIALIFSELFLWLLPNNPVLIGIALILFFAGFSLLEAFLPSLISRTAPALHKGSAMGIYSCSQFLGIFVGGLIGGWLNGQFGFSGVYLFSIISAFIWLSIAFFMQPPHYLITQILKFMPSHQLNWEIFANQLQTIPGIHEVTFVTGDNTMYLKMERSVTEHPDFIRLKEQLQSN